jgi:glycosyltransferase involved in cell wall biosynthesis
MKVSLIATVLDADAHVGDFLASIARQTRPPDEVVVVDGGSTDGTLERLRAADGISLIEVPGANIARGRNVAIAHAAHEVIAVADADCSYDDDWLARLLAPLEAGAEVAMGVTEPVVGSFFDAVITSNLPVDPGDVDGSTFLPSARSVAYRREAIDAVGGYPEWLAIGEDMWVDIRWRERALDMRLAPDAVARWHPRGDVGALWRQYHAYGRGDGEGGMHPDRHALRFATYGGLALAIGSRRRWPKMLAAAAAIAYAAEPIRRTWARRPHERARALIAVPAFLALSDVAKMTGYIAGLRERARRQAS